MRVAGYAAVFGRPDRGGDVVRPGAFERSLARGASSVPLLWQHDPARPVGRIEYLREDGRGLRVIARLSAGPAGRALEALGLSDGKARRDMDELRELLQAWRDAKKSAWQAVASWVVRILLALLVLGMSVRLGLLELLK